MATGDVVDVFEVLIELEPHRGSRHFGECVGLAVCLYVRAESLRESLDSAEDWAMREDYEVIDLHQCQRIEVDRYEPATANAPSAEDLSFCLNSGEVVVGAFHTYETISEH